MYLASNHEVFYENKKRLTNVSENFPGKIKILKHLQKISSLHKDYSDYSSFSISITLSDKYENKDKIYHDKKKHRWMI